MENNLNNKNDLKYLLIYKEGLEKIYNNQNKIFDKFIFYISNKILVYTLEYYLKRFYTIYIYILSILKENNTIEYILKDLYQIINMII